MLVPNFTNKFKKDRKLIRKRGLDVSLLDTVMKWLIAEEELSEKYQDHALIGNYKGHRECHIQPDWLLIYYIENGTIVFVRTGSHSDLF